MANLQPLSLLHFRTLFCYVGQTHKSVQYVAVVLAYPYTKNVRYELDRLMGLTYVRYEMT
jgi:hypothetical protein